MKAKNARRVVINPPDSIADLLSGPAAAMADQVIEQAGVLNVNSDGFSGTWGDALFAGPSHRQFNVAIKGVRNRSVLMELDAEHTAACIESAETGYFIGVAVGLKLAGKR